MLGTGADTGDSIRDSSRWSRIFGLGKIEDVVVMVEASRAEIKLKEKEAQNTILVK